MFYGALNPLPDGVEFAVMEDDKLLFRTFAPMKSREASGLPLFVEKELTARSLKLEDIKRWSVGAGPGGFTALRMTASLVAAWAFGKDDIKFRCVPGAVAMTGSRRGNEGDRLDCLFDGRNREILLYSMIFKDNNWQSAGFTAVLDAEKFARYNTPERKYLACEKELAAIRQITGDQVPISAVTPDAAELILEQSIAYNNDPDALVYIREAVELKA